MDYKKVNKSIIKAIMLSTIVFSFYSCAEEKKVDNVYYVELVNFSDSLKNVVSTNINGKVSFHKNNKLEIVSLNYITEDYPDMQYFENIGEIDNPIKPGSRKIRIEFSGKYSIDSIKYSLQKFVYTNNNWWKTSDIGFIRGVSTYKTLSEYALMEYGNQIINSLVTYIYE